MHHTMHVLDAPSKGKGTEADQEFTL